MATRTTCDGTGIEIPDNTPTTGLFGHQYSAEARAIAEQYLAELDTLHTHIAERFAAELGHLRTRYRDRLAMLPDDV